MWKALVALLSHCVVIVLVLVFCGSIIFGDNNVGKEKFDGQLEKNVVIKVLENDTAIEQGYFKELLDAFNAEYAKYGIKAIDANIDQNSDLENDGPYGYGPDVLYQANDQLMKYVDGKHILPLPISELECYDKVDENAWKAYRKQLGDETYYFGVPVNVQGPLMYYRKDLLPSNWKTTWDENSNDIPDMLESWNEMYRYSKQVKESSGGKKYGYMKSLFDVYFASGYLFSYGGYVFGNDNTDTKDIGFSKGESEKGANIIKQLASVMNEECIDDTITKNAYSKLADGTYFATMTTPDVFTLFFKELVNEYQRKGMTKDAAEALARENLVVTDIPDLPKSGNLEERNPELIPCIMMGGINGYAISSYTKSPDTSLAFVDFATRYEKIKRRSELLGIVAARQDVAQDIGGLTEIINDNLMEGKISIMPSVKSISQIWSPVETMFSNIAKDAFRNQSDQKFKSLQDFKIELVKVDKQVYDAIWTLS